MKLLTAVKMAFHGVGFSSRPANFHFLIAFQQHASTINDQQPLSRDTPWYWTVSSIVPSHHQTHAAYAKSRILPPPIGRFKTYLNLCKKLVKRWLGYEGENGRKTWQRQRSHPGVFSPGMALDIEPQCLVVPAVRHAGGRCCIYHGLRSTQ